MSGNQGTQNLSFNIRGKLLSEIQEMNHYSNTWKTIKLIYSLVVRHTLLFEIERQLHTSLEEAWNLTYPDLPYIPDGWDEIMEKMQEFLTPNCIDLIRFRHVDVSSIMYEILANATLRMDFIQNINKIANLENIEEDTSTLAKELVKQGVVEKVKRLVTDVNLNDSLKRVIMNYDSLEEEEVENLLGKTDISETMRDNLVATLEALAGMDDGPYDISYEDITVDELRKRIKTFNNLIVRLPRSTVDERIAARNTFMDWKRFVDEATKYLVKEEMLFVVYEVDGMGERIKDENGEDIWAVEYGVGTDGREHPYTEVYTDPTRSTPLIDYSYIKVVDGRANYDRFDYWTVDDFR